MDTVKITIEGAHGTGKTRLAQHLESVLFGFGHEVKMKDDGIESVINPHRTVPVRGPLSHKTTFIIETKLGAPNA